MNKIASVTTLLAALAGATAANAAQTQAPVDDQYQTKDISGLHTFTLGYAQSHIQHFKNIKGLNLKYRYEIPQLPLSAMVSLTWMDGRGSQFAQFDGASENIYRRVRDYSLMVGPAYRITHWASIYALAGPGWESSTNITHYRDAAGEHSGRKKRSSSRFAWGAGMQFNLIDNLALDVGYQGGHILKTSSNGFNVGVGYRF